MKIQAEEKTGILGEFKINVIDVRSRKVLRTIKKKNLVTMAGKTLVRDLLDGDSSLYVLAFAIGTGTTAPAIGDTALETEVFRDTFTSFDTPTATKVTFNGEVLSTEENGQSITELGLLNNASSGGTLFSRVTFDAISKTSAIELQIQYSVTIT